MPNLRTTALLVTAALVVLPAAGADGGQAPTLSGAFNSGTLGLTLNWSPPPGTPNGVTYTLYRNGVAIMSDTTATSSLRDLSPWSEGVRDYTVTVTYPNGTVSPPSLPFRVVKDVQVPDDCPQASLSIYTKPPGADYTVYTDCLEH